MDALKKNRSINFKIYEKELLCEIIKDYSIILSASKDVKTRLKKDNAWVEVKDKFNSDENVTARSIDSLKTCYTNLVQRAKADDAEHSREIRKTGGGPSPPTLSAIATIIKETAPQVFHSISGVPDDDEIGE